MKHTLVATAAVLSVIYQINCAAMVDAYDYKNPPSVTWSGSYQPFQAKTSYLKTLSIVQKDRGFALDGTLIVKDEKSGQSDSLSLRGAATVAHEKDSEGKFENLFILCKDAKDEPFLFLKADNFTPEGKAHPGQYFFYNCYFTSGKPGFFLSGRLSKASK